MEGFGRRFTWPDYRTQAHPLPDTPRIPKLAYNLWSLCDGPKQPEPPSMPPDNLMTVRGTAS